MLWWLQVGIPHASGNTDQNIMHVAHVGRLVGTNFNMARTNWKKLGIEELQYRYGFERNIAEHYWENAYRQALRRARKAGVTKNFNVSREVYASSFYQGSQLFSINFTSLSPSVNIASEFSSVVNLEKAFTEKRFENMAKKYKEVDKLLQRYKKGKISYATFRDKIKQFRDTNREYQKAGS